jgi:hypothetical protein
MALKTLQCCGNASLPEPRSALRAIQIPPPKYIHKLGGLSPIHSMHQQGAQSLMWGARGPFLPVAAMVVAVVTPVVFCAKATEILKNAKNTKGVVHTYVDQKLLKSNKIKSFYQCLKHRV